MVLRSRSDAGSSTKTALKMLRLTYGSRPGKRGCSRARRVVGSWLYCVSFSMSLNQCTCSPERMSSRGLPAPSGSLSRTTSCTAPAGSPSALSAPPNLASLRMRSSRPYASTLVRSTGSPLSRRWLDPGGTTRWLASIASATVSFTCMRLRGVARAGKFWLTSCISLSGSADSTTRCAACMPRSFRSHTFRVSSVSAALRRESRNVSSSASRSGRRSTSVLNRKPFTSSPSASSLPPPPPPPPPPASGASTFVSSMALYSMFLIASSAPKPPRASLRPSAPCAAHPIAPPAPHAARSSAGRYT